MRIWAKVITDHKIQMEAVQEHPARPSDLPGWSAVITALVRPFDLAVPVILPKHIAELKRFSRTAFKPQDFMEPVEFDSFEMEIFPEKKKDVQTQYHFG